MRRTELSRSCIWVALIVLVTAACSDGGSPASTGRVATSDGNATETVETRGVDEVTATESSALDTSRSGEPPLPGIDDPDLELAARLEAAWRSRGRDYRPRTEHLADDGAPRYTNRLILQSSPYLLQHAHNPVNWYPWGDEAFERARREGKPVLMSVGYSTCHWCHVMERESFEDEEVARFLNEHFVAIKVDREERPDVDDIYMKAVQMLTGRGGWPMTVAMTPEAKPFFGGTYFPARDGDRGVGKGFLTILRELSDAYRGNPERVVEQAELLTERIQAASRPQKPGEIPGPEAIYLAASRLARAFDPFWGGFGGAPKFPRPVAYELLLHHYRRTNDSQALEIVRLSLEKMAAGGMYDHVGGGFHRYSTDHRWLVPHFEKMLYDNAQLVCLYLDAHQVTGDGDFARVAVETLDYVAREMTSPEGGFYSATDADSLTPSGEMEEGYFFTWTPEEIVEVVGAERARLVETYYAVTKTGNFEGRNILNTPRPLDVVAEELARPAAQLRTEIDAARAQLRAARAKRPPPLRDDKILTAWNGLMISAFARGALVLARDDYAKRATGAADFVLTNMRDENGRLLRSHNERRARHDGYLDDYAFFIQGLLDLYEAAHDIRWLEAAIELQQLLDDAFFDDEKGGYFMTGHDHEALLARDKPEYDGAEPSGNSIAVSNLLRLEELTTQEKYRKRAEATLAAFGAELKSGSTGVPRMLAALDFYLDEPLEILIVSNTSDPEAREPLLATVRKTYVPNHVLAVTTEGTELERAVRTIPLLEGKSVLHDRSTAYVCKKGYCERPTSDPEILGRQLRRANPLMGDESAPALPAVKPAAEPTPWQYDPGTDRHWHPVHRHWHEGRPPKGS